MRAIDQAQLLQRKAAQDLAVLRKLINDPTINTETLGFHAQQAAEKLIKALLALGGHDSPAPMIWACCSICSLPWKYAFPRLC
jgi:HEPN domain-containing protein